MGLRGYIAKRAVYMAILVWFVITLNYVIFEAMPGTPASIENLIYGGRISDPEVIKKYEDIYGLNDDPLTKYVKYFRNMLTFNFQSSLQSGEPVQFEMGTILKGRLHNTLLLVGVSSIVAIAIGILMGVVAARWRGHPYDTFSVVSSLTLSSLPTFFIGLLLIESLSDGLRWFPSGNVQPFIWAVDPASVPTSIFGYLSVRASHLFLPVLTLTMFTYGGFLLLARATTGEALTEDYILTARAKGLPEHRILLKHALKNASLPIITSAALQFGFLLSGAIITETVFNWNGLGNWLWDAIQWQDFPVIQAMFYIIGLTVIFANFASDLLYGVVDPRIKYE